MTLQTPHSLSEAEQRLRQMTHRHWVEEAVLVVLLFFVYIGVAWTDVSPTGSQMYWYLMVPLFFVASLIVEWPNVRSRQLPLQSMLAYQFWQWLAVLAAVKMIFVIQQIGRLNNETTGLVLLLVFALTTFVTGIRMGWLFRLVGLFLGASLLLIAYFERYLWVLAVAGILALLFLHLAHRAERKLEARLHRDA